jgi:hypothetical protein
VQRALVDTPSALLNCLVSWYPYKRKRKFLKQRYEANHIGEPDYSLDQNTVINLTYFNYAKANKLKVNASKKTKKLLAGMDFNNFRKFKSLQLNKSNKSAAEDVGDNSSEKPNKNAQNAGNEDTTPQRSVRRRTIMISSPDQRRQIWLLVVKVNLLLGESRKLIV